MPAPTKGPRLGGGAAHEKLILANLATSLFEHGRIKTTQAKARRLRPVAERLITFAKRGDLAARRRVMMTVRDKSVVHTLFTEIGPRYESRPGGYTRITKIGPRKGDNAPMAIIELVEGLTVAQTAVREAEAARGTQFATKKGATATAGATASTTAGEELAQGEVDEDAVEADEGAPEAAQKPKAAKPAKADKAKDSASLDDLMGGSEEAAEGGDQAAEGTTSAQTEAASEVGQAEGDKN